MSTHRDPEDWDEPAVPCVDGAWGRTANPNTADGELQNAAAFSAGFSKLQGRRRTFALVIVWLILAGFATSVLLAVVAIVALW